MTGQMAGHSDYIKPHAGIGGVALIYTPKTLNLPFRLSVVGGKIGSRSDWLYLENV